MKVAQEDRGGVHILRVSGQIVGGPEGEALRDSIQNALAQGRKKILIDLRDVTWVNSTGLGILISGHLNAAAGGGSLTFSGASRRIESIFEVTRLNTVFQLFPDEESALVKMAG